MTLPIGARVRVINPDSTLFRTEGTITLVWTDKIGGYSVRHDWLEYDLWYEKGELELADDPEPDYDEPVFRKATPFEKFDAGLVPGVFIRETNEDDNGFHAEVYIDPDLPGLLSFEFSHVMDGETSEEDETVGVLMSREAAFALATVIIKVASKLPA